MDRQNVDPKITTLLSGAFAYTHFLALVPVAEKHKGVGYRTPPPKDGSLWVSRKCTIILPHNNTYTPSGPSPLICVYFLLDRPDEVYDERPWSLDKAKDLTPSTSETTAYKKKLMAETQDHTRAYREGESRGPLLCYVFESEEIAAVCGDGNFGCEKVRRSHPSIESANPESLLSTACLDPLNL